MAYYWTLWQSEVAKDYIFESVDALKPLMDDFLRYSLINGTGERILKYFGAPVKANGQPGRMGEQSAERTTSPRANSNPEIISRANLWYDGLRVRHWNGKNSVKFYNEHNVLRFETTMNDPAKFKIYRHAENQDKSEDKKLMPMRKGIADISVRAEVSKRIVDRFTEHMSAAEDKTRLGDLLSGVSKPKTVKGKKVRAIEAFGKDQLLLTAISDPAFDVAGITNKQLRLKLKDTPWAKGMNDKQLSGRITRHISLLRNHGLIKKLPNQSKYILTDNGRLVTSAVAAALGASVNDLLHFAA